MQNIVKIIYNNKINAANIIKLAGYCYNPDCFRKDICFYSYSSHVKINMCKNCCSTVCNNCTNKNKSKCILCERHKFTNFCNKHQKKIRLFMCYICSGFISFDCLECNILNRYCYTNINDAYYHEKCAKQMLKN